MRITRTPVSRLDEPFLFALYSETRADELALVPWDNAQKNTFLLHQFQSQYQHYKTKYENAHFHLINLDDRPVGRLYTAELADEIRILDIIVSAEFRGKNIASMLIKEILHEAENKNKAVRIYLELNGKSSDLFTRLGFGLIADEGIHQLWEKPAARRIEIAKGQKV